MKKFFTFFAALILCFKISAQTPLEEAVDFSSVAHNGEEINLFEILDNGQYVLIDFFFTTCGPCKATLPYVIDTYYAMGSNQEDIFFMEISPTDLNWSIGPWLEQYDIPYPTIHTQTGGMTGDEIYEMYQIKACPTIVLIAPDRKIIHQDYYPKSSEYMLRDITLLMKNDVDKVESLDTPSILSAEAVDSESIKLTWAEVDDAYRYSVYSGGELIEDNLVETTFTIEKLEAGTEYCFSVMATFFDVTSDMSEEVCAKTLDKQKIEVPANITATATISSVTLTWDAVDGATAYNVYRGTSKLATVEDTTFTENDLQADTRYCYMITTVVGTEESTVSEEVCVTTTTTAPSIVVENLVATATSTSSIKLTWDAVENATAYNIYQGEEKTATATEPTYTVENLEYDTNYCFSVAAVVNDTESEKSEEACAKTMGEGLKEFDAALNIYPNPVDNELLLATEVRVEEISIYDIYGRMTKVYALQSTDIVHSIDVADLEAGVYFVNIKTEKGNFIKRFLKK